MDLESEVSDNSIIYFGKFGYLGLVSNNVCHCQIADTPCWLISLIVCSKRMLQSMGLLRLITITCPCQIIVIQEYLPVGGYPGLIFANINLSSESGYPGLTMANIYRKVDIIDWYPRIRICRLKVDTLDWLFSCRMRVDTLDWYPRIFRLSSDNEYPGLISTANIYLSFDSVYPGLISIRNIYLSCNSGYPGLTYKNIYLFW